MSTENLEVMRQIYDVFSTGDADRADSLLAADLVEQEGPPAHRLAGRGSRSSCGQPKAGFPDLQCQWRT